jgi:radical SAM superfamily enzyme YgiQ (UPF0313 family)
MYPSGALLLIGTMCEAEGHPVIIYDGAGDKRSLLSVLSGFHPDIVGITVNTFQTKYANKYLNIIKSYDKSILTVIGGPHPSGIGLKSLSDFPNADIAVMGEGEFTFLDIVNSKPLEDILGICYDGKRNLDRPPIEILNHIPLTDLSLVDLSKYSSTSNDNEKSMFIMASRGCPFQCIYCNKSIFGSKVRFRDPDDIIKEIKWLNTKYGINHIFFQDDTFNLNRHWINEILNLIIKNGLNETISYMAPFRVNTNLVDTELLTLAKKANFKTIFYGVESGNQEMLDRMHKGTNINEIKRAFRLTHALGINTIAAFIIGLPGESSTTIKDTLELWKIIKPTYSGFTLATPFPNTVFEDEIKQSGHLLNSNYNEYRCGGSYVRTEELTRKELEYYSNIAAYGCVYKWIYKLPIFKIGKNHTLRTLSLLLMNIYKRWKS